jgi:hypothetical protein
MTARCARGGAHRAPGAPSPWSSIRVHSTSRPRGRARPARRTTAPRRTRCHRSPAEARVSTVVPASRRGGVARRSVAPAGARGRPAASPSTRRCVPTLVAPDVAALGHVSASRPSTGPQKCCQVDAKGCCATAECADSGRYRNSQLRADPYDHRRVLVVLSYLRYLRSQRITAAISAPSGEDYRSATLDAEVSGHRRAHPIHLRAAGVEPVTATASCRESKTGRPGRE